MIGPGATAHGPYPLLAKQMKNGSIQGHWLFGTTGRARNGTSKTDRGDSGGKEWADLDKRVGQLQSNRTLMLAVEGSP